MPERVRWVEYRRTVPQQPRSETNKQTNKLINKQIHGKRATATIVYGQIKHDKRCSIGQQNKKTMKTITYKINHQTSFGLEQQQQ